MHSPDDYIVTNGGTIYEAVSGQPWSGESAVHMSMALRVFLPMWIILVPVSAC